MNNSIRYEWDNMRCFPIFEYKISESDYLIVELSLSEDNRYKITVDPGMSLDHHLQLINDEMTEGYLLPNGLYCDE